MPLTPATTDKVTKVGNPGSATTLSAPGYQAGVSTSMTVPSTTNWPTDTKVIYAVDRAQIVNGKEERIPGTYNEFEGIVTGANTISNVVKRLGTTQNYPAGSLTRVYIPVAATRENDLVEGFGKEHGLNGKHGDILPSSVTTPLATITSLTVTNLTVGSQTPSPDWQTISTLPTSFVHQANRNYLATVAADVTNILSEGMKIRGVRAIAAPTQAAVISSSNWLSKASPNKFTFNDNFTLHASVRLTAYPPTGNRYVFGRGDSGSGNAWGIYIDGNGRIGMIGANGGGSNFRNAWSHARLALLRDYKLTATWAAGVITLYVDGQQVLGQAGSSGTAPTTVGQAGDFTIGRLGLNASTQIQDIEISQVAVFDAVLNATQVKALGNSGVVGNEANLKSAWSLNGVLTDLNTATPNDLTNNNVVTFVTGGSFGNYGASANNEYGLIVSKPVFSGGNTSFQIQAPAGCLFPTVTTPLSAWQYSVVNAPLGFPRNPLLLSGFAMWGRNDNAINPGNGDFNLDSSGACVAIYSPVPTIITVTVDIGLSSTSDFEFGVGVYDNAVSVAHYQPHAAPASASGRAQERTVTRSINITAGYHTIAAKLALSSSTSANIQPTGVNINVTLPVPIMA